MATNRQNSRPLIGVSMRYDWEHEFYYLRQTYADAIYGAGGAPLYIPLITDADYLESLVDRLDGVVLAGSNSDVDPLRYGANPHQKLGPVVPRRDATDAELLRLTEAHRVPLLAICYGFQALNVYRGGTLIQDIPSQVEGAIQHAQEGYYVRHSHTISVAEDTLLEEIAGGTSTVVNSHHHQGVERLGRELVPVAWAPDGIVEAVESEGLEQWVFGVQWHPEVGWAEDPLSKAIFGTFLEAAKER
jgi:putative glutamine amidotransferase